MNGVQLFVSGALAMLLCNCSPEQHEQQTINLDDLSDEIEASLAEAEASRAAVAEDMAPNQPEQHQSSGAATGAPMDDIGTRDEDWEPTLAEKEAVQASLCWQDYCPCDPPQGGPDKGLCRQLRAGIHVDEQLLSLGAMMRDTREELEEFEQENPGTKF